MYSVSGQAVSSLALHVRLTMQVDVSKFVITGVAGLSVQINKMKELRRKEKK